MGAVPRLLPYHTTMSRLVTPLLLLIAALVSVCDGGILGPPKAHLLKEINLRVYGSSVDDFADYRLETEADKLLEDARYRPDKPTVFYFHGYLEHADKESVHTVVSAFLRHGGYNVVFVDWSKAAAEFYVIPMLLVPELGRTVARQLDAWHESSRLRLDKVYLVGHSLGGQAAGFTGKAITKGLVPRITALDPALPGFMIRPLTSNHIASTDGQFVDAIHTDGGNYGTHFPVGHADFYPNGGVGLQPGCPANAERQTDEDFCSHWVSWRVFAESLNTSLPPFEALACDSQDDFVAGKCDNNERAVMGFPTNTSTRGTFFLETSATTPFSRGADGLRSTQPGSRVDTPVAAEDATGLTTTTTPGREDEEDSA